MINKKGDKRKQKGDKADTVTNKKGDTVTNKKGDQERPGRQMHKNGTWPAEKGRLAVTDLGDK